MINCQYRASAPRGIVKLQAKSLGVDFVLPLSQEEEQEEQEPPTKIYQEEV